MSHDTAIMQPCCSHDVALTKLQGLFQVELICAYLQNKSRPRPREYLMTGMHSAKSDLSCSVQLLRRVRLFATPWTVAYQVPPSMGFSRQEYWSALPFPSLGDLPDPGSEPGSPALQADALTLMMRLCNRTWQELLAPSIQGQLQILLGPRQAT